MSVNSDSKNSAVHTSICVGNVTGSSPVAEDEQRFGVIPALLRINTEEKNSQLFICARSRKSLRYITHCSNDCTLINKKKIFILHNKNYYKAPE